MLTIDSNQVAGFKRLMLDDIASRKVNIFKSIPYIIGLFLTLFLHILLSKSEDSRMQAKHKKAIFQLNDKEMFVINKKDRVNIRKFDKTNSNLLANKSAIPLLKGSLSLNKNGKENSPAPRGNACAIKLWIKWT